MCSTTSFCKKQHNSHWDEVTGYIRKRLQSLMEGTKLEGADDIPDACIASQRNLEMLATWLDSSHTELKQIKGHTSQLRRNKPVLVSCKLEHSCAEKDPLVLGNSKLTWVSNTPWQQRGTAPPWHIRKTTASRSKEAALPSTQLKWDTSGCSVQCWAGLHKRDMDIPTGQTKGKEVKAPAVEVGTDILRRVEGCSPAVCV